jgi:hypothetical protein
MVEARSFFAKRKGRAIAERKSCGRKASDSRCMSNVPGADEFKYSTVL